MGWKLLLGLASWIARFVRLICLSECAQVRRRGEPMQRLKVLSWIFVLVFVGLVGLGFVLVRRGFSARDNPSALEAIVARTVRKMAIPAAARDAKNPFTVTPGLLAEARAHFADHCATCHANDGGGQTTIGQNLYPQAPDMRLPQTQNLSDGEIYYIIHNGIRLTGMPAWGKATRDEDSWKLVLFIRHLPKITPSEVREMERLNPRSAAERAEEEEERRFLNESEPPKPKGKQPH